jgi:predicted DNA-binding transcriptional regulator AlpA
MGPFLDEKRLAAELSVSLAALRRWRYAGAGPKFSKFGASVRYAVNDVEAWIASRPTADGR